MYLFEVSEPRLGLNQKGVKKQKMERTIGLVAIMIAMLVAVGGVASAGYVPDGHIQLDVKSMTGATQGIFYELPANYTVFGDLDMDGVVSRDSDDIMLAYKLRELTPIVYTDELYNVAADMSRDGVLTQDELSRVISMQVGGSGRTYVPVCVTYIVGDHNGNGLVHRDRRDLVTTLHMCYGLLPYDEVGDFDLDGGVDWNDFYQHKYTHMGRIPEVTRTVCV